MNNSLYIPTTISVGFKERSDTFTGKLGYVIYTDHTGKLRKEASWNTWRDNKIAPVQFPNTPQLGFTFNKGIKRDAQWGSGRSVIRVYDPRDFEFEISVDNLIGILMHSDVSKRDIVQDCVFAWKGTELVLLPINSVEYQESVKHTDKQAQTISAKSLIIGATYTIKKEVRHVVYLGRFDRWDFKSIYVDDRSWAGHQSTDQVKKKTKCHVFMDPATHEVFVKDPIAFLAYCDQEEMHPQYAALMEQYYKSAQSQPIASASVITDQSIYCYRGMWKQMGEHQYVQFQMDPYSHNLADLVTVDRFALFDVEKKQMQYSHEGHTQSYYSGRAPIAERKLPGIDANRADIKTILNVLCTEYTSIFNLNNNYTISYQERDALVKAETNRIKTKYNIGYLYPILQSGAVATDHSF
jgi:hypothetical protein